MSAEWQNTKQDLLVSLGLQTVPMHVSGMTAGAGGTGAATGVLPGLSSSQRTSSTAAHAPLPASVQQFTLPVDALVTPTAGMHSKALPLVSNLAAAAESTLSSAGMETGLASDLLLPWRVLRHVVRGERGAQGPQAGAFAQAYLAPQLQQSPLVGNLGVFWAGGSLNFMETYSSEVVDAVLRETGGASVPWGPMADAVIMRHALYMKKRLQQDWDALGLDNTQHVTLPNSAVTVPFWAMLWHLLRFGGWLSPARDFDLLRTEH